MNWRHPFRLFRLLLCLALFLISLPTRAQTTARPAAAEAVIVGAPSGPGFAGDLEKALTGAGYRVRRLDWDAALAPGALDNPRVRCVALPDARRLPQDLHAALVRFLHRGGNLLAFGLPGWKETLIKGEGGKWESTDAYARRAAFAPAPGHTLPILTPDAPGGWRRATNDFASSATYEFATDPTAGGPVLHAVVADQTGWDTYGVGVTDAFRAGEEVTVFAAKGDAHTTSLAIEWQEKDGSRWIAAVPLTTQWRRYELPPEAFHFWESVPARGGDHFRPENAARLAIGVAFSHTGPVGGRKEWWFANLGTAPR